MTETGEPALLAAPVLVVVQRAKFASSRAEYDIYAPDGTPYGSVHQQFGSGAGFFGQLATITYDVVGADGQLLMQLTKPGNIGRAHFEVAWGNGSPIGSIEQENLLLAPQFALTATDGTSARLSGGAMLSWEWRLEDGTGQAVGSVSKEFAGLAELFTSADRFVVQLSSALTGAIRALAIVATVCLDEVRTAKRRR
jgi:uncharacterized protein YxjI